MAARMAVLSWDPALAQLPQRRWSSPHEGGVTRRPHSKIRPPETVVINRQENKLLLEALAGLSPVQRDVLVLREMAELSYKDIAKVMGIEIGTVMSRLSRARAELHRVLQCRADYRYLSNGVGSHDFAAPWRRA